VVIEPSNPRIIFAGADESLYKSTDGGNTWAQVSSASIWDVRLIVADAGGIAGHIVIGSDQGLFASNDNGVTWSSLNGNITSNILYTISVAGKTILTGAQDFSAIASFDGGARGNSLRLAREVQVSSIPATIPMPTLLQSPVSSIPATEGIRSCQFQSYQGTGFPSRRRT
jgi:hypothetical protein